MNDPFRPLILIPAYNAADTLGDVLGEVRRFDAPVWVVDDGSTDQTAKVADEGEVSRVLTHERNQGKGAALKTGFAEASGAGFSHALTFDADGQHPPTLIPDFLRTSESEPRAILVGNRFASEDLGDMPLHRRLSNHFSSLLISLAAKTRVPDAQCGMRVYPLQMLSEMELSSDGFAMETEVLVKAGRGGVKVVNVPIPCHYPKGTETSGYQALRDSWRIAKVVVSSIRESGNR